MGDIVARKPAQPPALAVSLETTDAARVEAEVKAMLVIAQQVPRNREQARERILAECRRPKLAEAAVYAFPRGTQTVSGPSIRLAEAMTQSWGNMETGTRMIDRGNGTSLVQVYAWDLETNTKTKSEFVVEHKRDTKQGGYKLTDQRDIYEAVANQAARRRRACILSLIPGDVVDAAVAECEATQAAGLGAAPVDVLKALVVAFEAFGITRRQIEGRLGHNLEATIAAEILNLKRVYASIRDGMAKVEDLFPAPEEKKGVKERVLAAAGKE